MDWSPLPQYFERATHRGVPLVDAAQVLLNALRNPESGVALQGRKRTFYWPDEPRVSAAEKLEWEYITNRLNPRNPCRLARLMNTFGIRDNERCNNDPAQPNDAERARLEARGSELLPLLCPDLDWCEHPRIVHAQPIPASFWFVFEAVKEDGTSSAQDDPDEPISYCHVDWISGTAEDTFCGERVTYSNLEINTDVAWELIDQAAGGNPRKMRKAIDETRHEFMSQWRGLGGVDGAWRAFKADKTRYDGTKLEAWRKEWRELGIPSPGKLGRPKTR